MIRVKNLTDYFPVPAGEAVVYRGSLEREVSIRVNTAGPCMVYVQQLDASGTKPLDKAPRYLLGMVENGQQEFMWRMAGNFAVTFDPTGEVWVYRDQTPLAIAGEGKGSFVRLEKIGVHVDELGVALHRQAVLNRLQRSQETVSENIRAKGLETRLAELAALVDSLKPKDPGPKVEGPDVSAQVDA